jgi:hypothetical protein
MQLQNFSWVQYKQGYSLEDIVNGFAPVEQLRTTVVARLMLASAIVICVAASARAQTGTMSPYQGERDGISVGGKWLEFDSEDKMTGAKKVRFLLVADNYFREDPNSKPRVQLFCSDGKLSLADFNPGARLGRPDYPGFWGQPKMEVMVRIDDYHTTHGWNWERGHFLAMDKGTVRGLIGAENFKIEVRTRGGAQIAEFSPGGLDLQRVRQSCDLTPKKFHN